jgi:iron complex outermembrane receptor protein
MHRTVILLGSVSALSLITQSASAQEDAATMADVEAAEEIIVFGRGQTRQVQELGREYLDLLAAGTSPLKSIEKLPSVNFQSADAFGAYEWSQRLSIRGFNQNQLGFTLDGIPLGDHSYGNVNGLHANRAISPENIGVTRVSQGAGALGTQATNNLGGTVEFLSKAPDADFGLDANASYGTENTLRGFVRLESGEIAGVEGTGAFLSYGYLGMDKWKGFGEQRQHVVNFKGVAGVGEAKVTAYLSFSDRRENDYQDLSLEMIDRLGYDWDNISDDFRLAVLIADIANNRGDTGAPVSNAAAGTTYPAPIATVDDAYFNASGLRRDYVASLGVDTPVGEMVNVALKAYWHDNEGMGLWYTPYVPTPGGAPISVRTTEYDIDRKGLFGNVAAKIGIQAITVGGWYEKNDFQQARRFYGLTDRLRSTRDSLEFQSNPFFTQWEFDFDTETLQYFVEDRISIGDGTITVGWKGFRVKNEANPIIAGGRAAGRIKSEDWFQPHVGFAYPLTGQVEAFGGFTQVTRAFTSATTSGPFSTTQAGFDAIRDTLKPEASDTYELGARIDGGFFNAVIGAYYVDFRNRLLGLATGAGIVGNPAVLQNVGSVRSYGFEAAGDFRLGAGFKLFASYSYNDSTYRDDVVNAAGAVVAATRGKTTVDAPKHLARGELSFDNDSLFARVAVNYMSRRYFNYENDRSVGGRALVDATLGYRLSGQFENVELQLNASNIFDKDYVATIGSNGFGNRGDNQTLLAGTPRQVFGTVKVAF